MPGIRKNTVGDVFTVGLQMGDVLKNMEILGERVGKNVFRRGLLAGAKVIGADARARAPRPRRGGRSRSKKIAKGGRKPARKNKLTADQPGYWSRDNLGRAIAWESRGIFRDGSGKPSGHRAVVIVKKRKGKRNARLYAHMVEFGTAPHAIKKGSILRIFKRSKRRRSQRGKLHPGARPRPFMRPAFDTKKREALKTIVDIARAEAAEEVRKLRAQPAQKANAQ